MTFELVLNELSLHSPAPNIKTAQERMALLVQTVQAATVRGANRALRTHTDLNDLVLADQYPIRRWRNDPVVDRDLRSFFRVLTSKAPYLIDLPEKEDEAQITECFCEDDLSIGLKIAHLLDALSISVLSEKRWDTGNVPALMRSLNDSGDWLPDSSVTIRHSSRPIHLQSHATWIDAMLRPAPESGSDLWERRSELFPHLMFCDSAARYLEDLGLNDTKVPLISRSLRYLDSYVESWIEDRFDTSQLRGEPSGESDPTMQQFAEERTFLCPDGQRRLFEWHQKIKAINWRIHFFPETRGKVMFIGYIGPHLRTMRHRT